MRVSIIRGVSFFYNKIRVTYFFRLAEVTDVSVSIRTAAHKNLSHTSISYCQCNIDKYAAAFIIIC